MTTTYTGDGVPVFGAGADLAGTVEFAIEALHVESGERQQHRFHAWRDPGPEFVLGFLRAGGSDEAAMSAAAYLVRQALIDHDGIPLAATPESLGEEWDDALEAWSSRRRFNHLVASGEHRIAALMLIDLAEFLAREAFKRGGPVQGEPVPTAAPSPSRRGRTTKQAGSKARRSATA